MRLVTTSTLTKKNELRGDPPNFLEDIRISVTPPLFYLISNLELILTLVNQNILIYPLNVC